MVILPETEIHQRIGCHVCGAVIRLTAVAAAAHGSSTMRKRKLVFGPDHGCCTPHILGSEVFTYTGSASIHPADHYCQLGRRWYPLHVERRHCAYTGHMMETTCLEGELLSFVYPNAGNKPPIGLTIWYSSTCRTNIDYFPTIRHHGLITFETAAR